MTCTCQPKANKRKKDNSKHFTVFLNGDSNFYCQNVVINRNYAKKWHHVLNEITYLLRPNFGSVKKLYSAESGVSLDSYTDLENNGKYVASDHNKFRFVKGGYKTREEKYSKIAFMQHYLSEQLQHANKIKKISKTRCDLIVIYVFMNGKNFETPQKFVLTKDDLMNWEYTLSFIGLVLDLPYRNVKYLYNSRGHAICGPWELQHGATYIAVGYNEKFIKKDYKIGTYVAEIWTSGIPVVRKDKNLPCRHRVNPRADLKNNVNWTKYLEENTYSICEYDITETKKSTHEVKSVHDDIINKTVLIGKLTESLGRDHGNSLMCPSYNSNDNDYSNTQPVRSTINVEINKVESSVDSDLNIYQNFKLDKNFGNRRTVYKSCDIYNGSDHSYWTCDGNEELVKRRMSSDCSCTGR